MDAEIKMMGEKDEGESRRTDAVGADDGTEE